LGQLRQADGS
jgi:hypothetical protein